MSSQIAKLISTITGSDKLEACLRISEINDINDFMNMDEKTLENIEKFIRKKCSSIPVNERSQFIDDEMIYNPEKFMIAPGLSQRILNTCNKVSTIFQNVPANETNIAAVSKNLLKNTAESSMKVNLNMLQNALNKDRFYHLNERQLCLTSPESALVVATPPVILPSTFQRFSLASRPRDNRTISPILHNFVSNDGVTPSAKADLNSDISKEAHLNPPEIETIPMETKEFEVVKKPKTKKTPVKKPRKQDRTSTNLVKSLAMEFLGRSNLSDEAVEEVPVGISLPPVLPLTTTIARTAPLTTVIKQETVMEEAAPSPVESVIITYVKAEPVDTYPKSPSLPIKSASKYRPPIKSRVNPIDYYYAKIVDDAARLFHDCSLVPKVDFDVELNVKGKVETKPCAHFVCYTCMVTSKSKTEKRLKFYLTSRGAIINSNILNHLKIHFKSKCDL